MAKKEEIPESLSQEELDALERKRRAELKEKRKKHEEFVEKWKVRGQWIFVILVICCAVGYYVMKTANNLSKKLEDVTVLNFTTNQISQLVDNIRNVYTVYSDEKVTSMKRLVEIGAIPPTLIDSDGRVVNPYGGDIIVEPSIPLENIKEDVESPTFKMSYQGLSHDTCVALGIMDWGNKLKGLLAIAVGAVDDDGVDSALVDIDKKPEPPKIIEFKDKRGRIRKIRERKHYQMNVAKPEDDFLPTPFPVDVIDASCSCSVRNNCSFALRYTVFGVDNPNRGEVKNQQEE